MDSCQAPLSMGFSRQEYWSALGPRCHKDICEEKGDLPEKVFNADENALFWGKKKCHEGHSLVKKRSKLQDLRLILWFCTNSVRFMIREVLIYRAANPEPVVILLVDFPVNIGYLYLSLWGVKCFQLHVGWAESHCSRDKMKVEGPVLANHVFKLYSKTYLEKAAVLKKNK